MIDPLLDEDFLQRFAHEMRVNAGKGDWRQLIDDEDMDWDWVLDELDDHVRKLKVAVKDGSFEKMREHAADIAGNAMFAHRFVARQEEWWARYQREELEESA